MSSDLSWSAALCWFAFGAGFALIFIGTAKRAKRKNRKVGLPSPACQRFPAWDAATAIATRRQVE